MSDLFTLLRPAIFKLDPERAHGLALAAIRKRLVSGVPFRDPILTTELWGLSFENPVGLAAGFDKDAEVPMQSLALGFGFVEIGSVTPKPQAGNPKPRLFRLVEDDAVINRMGFNSKGLDIAEKNLRQVPHHPRPGIIGVNFGKNKETEDAAADYEKGIRHLSQYADYIVINVSSPNTPGLRALQSKAALEDLVGRSRAALDTACPSATPPMLIKVAPDLTEDDIADISDIAKGDAVDGLIATNTTLARPMSLKNQHKDETGGLSGRPLMNPSTKILGAFFQATEGRVPIIGVGGIASGADAYAKIRAGASLVQLYSGMVYEGPSLPGRINRALAGLLRRDGYNHVSDAVGADFV